MIDVEHGALRPFKQDSLAVPQSEIDHQSGGLDGLGVSVEHPLEVSPQRLRFDALLDPYCSELLVHTLSSGLDGLCVVHHVCEVSEPDSDPLDAVAVSRADSTASGAHEFVGAVVEPVERQDYRGSLADEQPLAFGPLAGECMPLFQFLIEHPRIDHHAVTEDEVAVIIGHPRGYLMEFECRIAEDDGVAGVVAALETDGPC